MLCLFELFLFCYACLLEWSRCCSYFALFWFVLFVFVFVVSFCLFLSACFFLVLMETTIFPAILVLFGLFKSESLFLISVSGSCFLFLFGLLIVSRCYFVLFFNLPFILFCFKSQCYIF